MRFYTTRMTKNIRPIDQVQYGKPTYKQGLSVPEISLKYGTIATRLRTMPLFINYMAGALRELFKAANSIKSNPYTGNKTITPELLEEMEFFAKSQGISDIGYSRVKDTHLFRDSVILFDKAIVFTMEMQKPAIQKAPSITTIREIFRTYYKLSQIANTISDFLRNKGFNAQPIPAISNNLNLTVMARDAGLGGFGKHGLLITKAFGPSIRLAAVLTDIENLPINCTYQHEWIKDFCDSCNICVKKCPVGAIYKTPIVFEDGSEEHIDYKKCAVPFSKNHGCTICIKECTFFKTDYDKIKNVSATN